MVPPGGAFVEALWSIFPVMVLCLLLVCAWVAIFVINGALSGRYLARMVRPKLGVEIRGVAAEAARRKARASGE